MSSRNYLKHTVSTTAPSTAGNLGDEWYEPITNKWYKLLANAGTTVRWVEINSATATVAVAAGLTTVNGNVSIAANVVATGYYTTGDQPSQLAATGNLTIAASGNIILIPGANSAVIGAGSSGGGGSGLFNTSITSSNNYLATNIPSNAIVFTAQSILHSIYVTNINTTGNANVGVTATINSAPLLWNMPLPYRSSFEALKKPKIVNAGDSLRIQGLIQGVGANSNVHATIVYEQISSGVYTGVNSNISTASANVDIFTATSAAIIESVMVSSTNNLGNVPITVTVTDSSNVIQGYMAYTLLVPVGATIELCEKPRRIATGHKLQAYTNAANALAIFVAAKTV